MRASVTRSSGAAASRAHRKSGTGRASPDRCSRTASIALFERKTCSASIRMCAFGCLARLSTSTACGKRLHRAERHEFEIDRDAVRAAQARTSRRASRRRRRNPRCRRRPSGARRRSRRRSRASACSPQRASSPTAAPSRLRAPTRRCPRGARRISACSAAVRSGYSTPPGEAGDVRSPIDAKPARAASSTSSSGGTSSSLRCASDSGMVSGIVAMRAQVSVKESGGRPANVAVTVCPLRTGVGSESEPVSTQVPAGRSTPRARKSENVSATIATGSRR